jgi:hypothetical protein
MPGFGSGLAHALTQGYVGAQEGMKDRDLIVLAAQQRAQQRQQQEREMKLKELGALSTAAQAGLDVTPTAPSAPSGPPSSVPPVAVADTASVRAVKGQNPTTPDGGESSPATPSQDGTVLGAVGGMRSRCRRVACGEGGSRRRGEAGAAHRRSPEACAAPQREAPRPGTRSSSRTTSSRRGGRSVALQRVGERRARDQRGQEPHHGERQSVEGGEAVGVRQHAARDRRAELASRGT